MIDTVVEFVTGLYPFMFRPYTGDVTTKVKDLWSIPEAMPHMAFATVCFVSFSFMIDRLVPLLFPAYYKAMPEKKKGELAAFMTSLAHHSYVVPYGIYFILNDLKRTDTTYDYKADMIQFIPVVGGYLFSDMIYCAIPDAMKGQNILMFGHHILGLGLVFFSFFLTSSTARFVPHLLICESSGIVFNLAWLVKSFGQSWAESRVVQILEYTFAVCFTLTRVVNLPFIVLACAIFAENATLRWVIGILMGSVMLLQFYWFGAIIKALQKKETRRGALKKLD